MKYTSIRMHSMLIAFLSVVLFACSLADTAHAQSGERLKNNADAYLMDIGFTAPYGAFEETVVRNQADYATVNLTPDEWLAPDANNPYGSANFVDSKQQVATLKRLGIKKINLHMLVGKQVMPAWFKNRNWTKAQLDQLMETWIRNVAQEFGDDLESVVVVNEAAFAHRWANLDGVQRWLRMGYTNGYPNYVLRAFELAKFYMPGVKLIYNDYDHEEFNALKSNRIYRLCRHLRDYGNKPDGIGFQAHFTINSNFQLTFLDATTVVDLASWRRNMQRFANLGIDSYITELDIGIPPGTPGDIWEYEQAKHMGYIADMAAADWNCKAVTMWKIRDGSDPGWRTGERASLYRNDNSVKDAFYGVQMGLIGVMLDRTYRLRDDENGKYAIIGSGTNGTNVFSHSSDPSWTYGKWVVRLGSGGTIRLESVGFPGKFMQATQDDFNPIVLAQTQNNASQKWTLRRSGTAWDRITLENRLTRNRMNVTGDFDGAWVTTHPANNQAIQDWQFILDD